MQATAKFLNRTTISYQRLQIKSTNVGRDVSMLVDVTYTT